MSSCTLPKKKKFRYETAHNSICELSWVTGSWFQTETLLLSSSSNAFFPHWTPLAQCHLVPLYMKEVKHLCGWYLQELATRCFKKHYRWKGKVCMSDFGLTCPFNNEDLGWSALMCYSDFTTKDFIASVATSVMCHCQHLDHLSMLSLKRWAGTQQICHLEHTHVAHQHQSERVWSVTCMWEAATV